MSVNYNSSYNFVIDTGTIIADTDEVQSDVFAEYIAALGANIDLDTSTPQGSLATGEIVARTAVMKNNADVANLLNPDLSYGIFLDAICAFLGITRGWNQSTQGNGIQITGNAQTTIPANSRVQTSNGDIFALTAAVTIPSGGTTTANIASQAFGNIALPLGNLTILDGTIGWGAATVLNTTTIVPGTTQLTDAQLKVARNQQLAKQGVGSSAAIQAAVLSVDNVTSALVVENNTGQFANPINGITFTLPNAMWVCVAGTATSADIAAALYAAHQGGCPWDYGAAGMGTPVNSPSGITVYDPATGLPYSVLYTTPDLLEAYVNITVVQQNSVSSPAPSIQNAMVNYATGQEQGEPGLVIGANVSAFEMAGAVARQLPGMYIKTCQVACVPVGDPAPTTFEYEVVLTPYQQAQLLSNNINVTVNT